MFPACQGTNTSSNTSGCDVHEAVSGCISENGAFHVGSLQLAAFHQDLSIRVNDSLGNIQRVMIVFRESERDHNAMPGSAILDSAHLRRVDNKRVLDVLS